MAYPHIHSFTGDHDWLHNEYHIDIVVGDRAFPSIAHAFLALKWKKAKWRHYCECQHDIQKVINKANGLKIAPIKNWDKVKVKVMYSLLEKKFEDNELRTNLLANDGILEYTNHVHDDFWGIDAVNFPFTNGKNILGKLLMKLRNNLKSRLTEEDIDLNEFL